MRKLLPALALALAALSANAYELSVEPGSTLDHLSSFNVTFPGYAKAVAENGAYYSASTSPATITNKATGDVPSHMVMLPAFVASNTVNITCSPDMVTQSYITSQGLVGMTAVPDGTYVFTIPAGALTLYDSNNFPTASEEITFELNFGTISYTTAEIAIDGPTGTVDEVTQARLVITPTPTNLDILDPQSFWLRDDNSMGFAAAYFEPTINDDMTVTLTLAEPFVKAGRYSVYICQDALRIDGDNNKAVRGANFSVSGSAVERKIVSQPANESAVEEILNIAVIFEGYESLSFKTDMIMLTGPTTNFYTPNNGAFDSPGIVFTPIVNKAATTPGTYTFTIPANYLTLDDTVYAEPLAFTWTINDESSLAEIEAEATGEIREYTLRGLRAGRDSKGIVIRVAPDGKAAKTIR